MQHRCACLVHNMSPAIQRILRCTLWLCIKLPLPFCIARLDWTALPRWVTAWFHAAQWIQQEEVQEGLGWPSMPPKPQSNCACGHWTQTIHSLPCDTQNSGVFSLLTQHTPHFCLLYIMSGTCNLHDWLIESCNLQKKLCFRTHPAQDLVEVWQTLTCDTISILLSSNLLLH